MLLRPVLLEMTLALAIAAGAAVSARAEVVFTTDSLSLTVHDDGTLTSLEDRATGTEYLRRPGKDPLACVYRGGRWLFAPRAADDLREPPSYRGGQSFPATAVRRAGDILTVEFAQANATARYRVAEHPGYVTFKLLELSGEPVDHVDMLRLPLRRLPNLGTWINVAHDDRLAICLFAGNVRTDAGMEEHDDHVILRSTAHPDVAAVGAMAVLLGCSSSQEQFLDAMEVVECDLDMPPGAALRRLPAIKESYLWASDITPENVDQFVEWAKAAGLPTILFSYTAFTRSAGPTQHPRPPARASPFHQPARRIRIGANRRSDRPVR